MQNRVKFVGLLDLLFNPKNLDETIEAYRTVKSIMVSDDLVWDDLIIKDQNDGNGTSVKPILANDDWVVFDSSYMEQERDISYKIRFREVNGGEAFGYYSKDYARKRDDGKWMVKRWLKDAQNKAHETDVAFSEI